jgi:hypothetical protein
VSAKTKFLEVDNWRWVGNTSSLYEGLVGSILEYGLVCYSRMARMLKLERVQYRRIRIGLRLIRSTQNNSLGGPKWHGTSGREIFVSVVMISLRIKQKTLWIIPMFCHWI